jgi:hypothetical protein
VSRPRKQPNQAQLPEVAVVTLALPVGETRISRSLFPTSGSCRQIVMIEEVPTAPDGSNTMVWLPGAAAEPVILYPAIIAGWLLITVPSAATTIQPSSQSPVPAQVVPSVDTHSVAGALRFIASLRAR